MTATVEIEFLEGISIDETPPCVTYIESTGKLCGQPSVARVHVVCACGFDRRGFICRSCLDTVKVLPKIKKCLGCKSHDFSVTES